MPIGHNDPVYGPGKDVWPRVRVAEEEEGRWEGVDEGCQHPGQELEGRQLGGTIFAQSQCQEWAHFDRLFFETFL